jgi:flagellar secretion chaperone FliS
MDARSQYREASVRGASPVRLVICLYEQAIEDLRRALVALEKGVLEKGAIESRTRHINHALMVVAQLESSLNIERGGNVAKNLARFYAVLRRGLVEAQVKQSARILQQQISHLGLVYEAWLEVERTEVEQATETPRLARPASAEALPIASSPSSFLGWNA